MATGYKDYNKYSQQDKDSMRTSMAEQSNENEDKLIGQTDEVEGLLKTTITRLETLIARAESAITQLEAVNANTDAVETKLDTINSSVTTVNTTLGSTNTRLDTLHNDLDTVESAINTQGGAIVDAIHGQQAEELKCERRPFKVKW